MSLRLDQDRYQKICLRPSPEMILCFLRLLGVSCPVGVCLSMDPFDQFKVEQKKSRLPI